MPGLLPEMINRRSELLPRFAAYYTQLRALPRRVRRALQRQWRLPLAGIALLLALGQHPGLAATIPVGGACTLIGAITAANTDTATGGCPPGNGADTIMLPPASTQTLTEVNNETYGPTGLPVIRSAITIAGNGSTIVRDSEAPEFRLVVVHSTGDLTLQETTVSGGVSSIRVNGDDTSYSGKYGGGVANFGGTLTVTNSTITGNAGDSGGGVANRSGTLIVTNSTISDNFANDFPGGGVANFGGTVTVTNSTISGNYTYQDEGGGIANRGGTLTVTNSIITGNRVSLGEGGGIFNGEGTLTVQNSTISDNDNDGGSGGGVANRSGTVTITNSTITGNYAYNGGGVVNSGGTVTITNSTITGNFTGSLGAGGGVVSAGTLTLARTLVAGNTAPTGPEIHNDGTVLANNHNLFGVDGTAGVEGFSPGATDIVPPAGVLLPDILTPTLAFHGGFTQTHALVPGSPAIDAGGPACFDANGAPLLTDQRGKPRPVDGDGNGTAACDIGAFEFFPLVNAFVTLDPDLDTALEPTPEAPAGTFTITATFTNTSATPLRLLFFTVTALSGDNLLLNADAGTQGVGATRTPAVGDGELAPGEAVVVDFVIGLQVRAPFTFFVDLFGELLR
jgi:hypothetical protein